MYSLIMIIEKYLDQVTDLGDSAESIFDSWPTQIVISEGKFTILCLLAECFAYESWLWVRGIDYIMCLISGTIFCFLLMEPSLNKNMFLVLADSLFV